MQHNQALKIDKLPDDILEGILKNTPPEDILTLSIHPSIKKRLSSPRFKKIWEEKFSKHFPHLKRAIEITAEINDQKSIDIDWYQAFRHTYLKEYKPLSNDEKRFISLIKEADVEGLKLFEKAMLSGKGSPSFADYFFQVHLKFSNRTSISDGINKRISESVIYQARHNQILLNYLYEKISPDLEKTSDADSSDADNLARRWSSINMADEEKIKRLETLKKDQQDLKSKFIISSTLIPTLEYFSYNRPFTTSIILENIDLYTLFRHDDETFNHSYTLYLSSILGHDNFIQKYIEAHPNIDLNQLYSDNDGNNYSPLSLAVINGKTSTIQLLINKHASPHVESTSLAHLAVQHGQIDSLRKLLELGQSIIEKNAAGRTPFHDASDKKFSAKHMHGHSHSLFLIKILIENGADINAQDDNGNTPLHIAILTHNNEIARHLVKQGANPDIKNNDGDTALHLAMASGSDLTLLKKLSGNINPNEKNHKNESLLDIALAAYNLTPLRYLLENKPPMLDNEEEQTQKLIFILQRCLYSEMYEDIIPIISALNQRGFNISSLNVLQETFTQILINGMTDDIPSQHLKKLKNKISILEFLFTKCGVLNEINYQGETLLSSILRLKSRDNRAILIELLVNSINITKTNIEPFLRDAFKHNNDAVIHLLLTHSHESEISPPLMANIYQWVIQSNRTDNLPASLLAKLAILDSSEENTSSMLIKVMQKGDYAATKLLISLNKNINSASLVNLIKAHFTYPDNLELIKSIFSATVKDYIDKRKQEKKYSGSIFGSTKSEKLEAASAFLDYLDGKTLINSTYAHLGIINKGKLGKIYTAYMELHDKLRPMAEPSNTQLSKK